MREAAEFLTEALAVRFRSCRHQSNRSGSTARRWR
jgi:hypothetical protein